MANNVNDQRLTTEDMVAIQQLNSRYAHALDGLVADAASRWAETFTLDGSFSIVEASGKNIVPEVKGARNLVALFQTFTDVAITRHWYNNLHLEMDEEEVIMSCYIVAMSIETLPARIIRTGLYRDKLSKKEGTWKFQNRTLVLDPGSPVGTK